MSRHTTAALLSAYLDEELQDEELDQVQSHLDECEPCRQHLVGMRSVVGALHRLERQAPPPVLGQKVIRRVEVYGQPQGLVQQLEGRLEKMRLDSSPFVTFALVLALAIILVVFAQSLQRSNDRTRLVVLPSVHEAVLGEWIFERRDGIWIVQGLEREGARVIAADSDEGRELRERINGLDGLLMDLPVVLDLESGEKVELSRLDNQSP